VTYWGVYLFFLVLANLKLLVYSWFYILPLKKKDFPKKLASGKILIQYPVRNEPIEIINRFLRSLEKIPEFHRSRFHLQILDDYTDPMPAISVKPCVSYEILRRNSRTGRNDKKPGYAKNKAGNLNYGLLNLKEKFDFVVIYDSDHQITEGLPIIEAAEILAANPEIVVVQSRWIFTNKLNSLVNLLQFQQMGTHIDREQVFRSYGVLDLYPIMNGAGAMFNLKYVMDTFGGWLERGVIEDVDISYQINARGKKIFVSQEWETLIDNPESYSSLRIQWRKWAQGNGQMFKWHFSEPAEDKLKKAFWLGWMFSFPHGFLKYPFLAIFCYRAFFAEHMSVIETLCLIPHLIAWIGGSFDNKNKFVWQRVLLYPAQYFLELGILDQQIRGWYEGFFSQKELEFDTTPKVA